MTAVPRRSFRESTSAARRAAAALGALTALAALAAVLAPAPGAAADQRAEPRADGAPARVGEPRPATYGQVTVPDVAVPASDGTVLVGDVLYPADPGTGERAPGTFPVLLAQNPYTCETTDGNLTGPGHRSAPPGYYVERGYVFASICVRGTGRSGGAFDMFGERERRDGVELVAWAADELDGSNGTVGLTGCSFLGTNQLLTAAALPPDSGVRAMMPACAGAETYRENLFSGGMPNQTLNVFRRMTDVMGERAGAFGAELVESITSGGERAYVSDWTRFRSPGEWAPEIVAADVPALLWSGTGDTAAQGSLEMFTYLQNAHAGRPVHAPMSPRQAVTGRYQVVVGPWGHGEGIDQAIAVQWFDTWLKDADTGLDTTPTPIHLHQSDGGTGPDGGSRGGSWINTSHYPLASAATPYYLGGGGRLTRRPSVVPGADTVAYTRPEDPDGSLTYTTEPFARGATLAGPVSATLYAGSDSANLHLVARLAAVAPDGTVTELTSGNLVGSMRALDAGRSWTDVHGRSTRPYGDFTGDAYLDPHETYELTFALSPRVARLAPGDALRVTLTTRTPDETCALPLGVDPCFATAPQRETLPGTYRVRHSLPAPSRIELPLLPYDCLSPSGGDGAQPDSFHGPPRSPLTPCTEGP